MSHHYILNPDGTTKPCGFVAWLKWMARRLSEDPDFRQIAHTALPSGVEVSTVFLGINCSWKPGPPLIFETLIFNGPESMWRDRYATCDEALAGHEKAVRLAESADREGPPRDLRSKANAGPN